MSGSTGYLLDTNVVLALIRANPLGQFIDQQYGLRAALNRSMVCVYKAAILIESGLTQRHEISNNHSEIVVERAFVKTCTLAGPSPPLLEDSMRLSSYALRLLPAILPLIAGVK
ncbi:MAG: hypothetical protein GX594_15530 [Pirellulaceae bacterium]|nr:hypothetical protein [Pirellulaceae bacterium]